MANPPNRDIVIAYHLIWAAYGWWLPNDPRGSMSKRIACDIIAELGELHYGRKRVQPAGWVIRDFYEKARNALQHELREFSGTEITEIGAGFAQCMRQYTCYACAIMPDHVHVLIRKHKHQAEAMIHNLQDASRLRLQKIGMRPGHPVWGGPGWKVFLGTPDEIRRTIHYINQNPVKRRMPAQEWGFVKKYDDWPFHKR